MTEIKYDMCQYNYPDLEYMTLPDSRRALRLRKIWWKWKSYAWHVRVMGPNAFLNRYFLSNNPSQIPSSGGEKPPDSTHSQGPLNLEPGELVEVRAEKEILATLDRFDKLKGLRYSREMGNYCGKKFKVNSKLKRIIVEDTGEIRTIKSPTVLLEGVICDGSAHGDCDRACFCYWREEWLKRVPPEKVQDVHFTRSKLIHASSSVQKNSGDAVDSKAVLNLEPGELVEVQLEKEIIATLDQDNKLKGIRFTPEMIKYCGKRFRVYKEVKKMLIETTGELRTMKSPIVLLDNVICDGSAHGDCGRACFCLWSEEWLKKVPSEDQGI